MEDRERFIIRRLREGDEEAYRYLYACHYVVLCRFANELVGDPFLAETIVGDLIFHLWEIRDTLDIQGSLRTYLIRAVRNRCYNYLESNRERREIRFSRMSSDPAEWGMYLPTDEQPLGKLLELELEGEIIRAIDRLGEECKRVFRKSRFEHKKNEEIASELGISVNTVKYHIKQALARLRHDLEKYLIAWLVFFLP